jgi:hypothetical protein
MTATIPLNARDFLSKIQQIHSIYFTYRELAQGIIVIWIDSDEKKGLDYCFLQMAAAQQASAKPAIAASGGSGVFAVVGAAVAGGTDGDAVQGSSHSRRHFCFASHQI